MHATCFFSRYHPSPVCIDANLELPPGIELSQLFHSLWQVDFVGITVPLLEKSNTEKKIAYHKRRLKRGTPLISHMKIGLLVMRSSAQPVNCEQSSSGEPFVSSGEGFVRSRQVISARAFKMYNRHAAMQTGDVGEGKVY